MAALMQLYHFDVKLLFHVEMFEENLLFLQKFNHPVRVSTRDHDTLNPISKSQLDYYLIHQYGYLIYVVVRKAPAGEIKNTGHMMSSQLIPDTQMQAWNLCNLTKITLYEVV
jgi:hypothetical protein